MTGKLRGEKYSLLIFDLDGTIADTIYSIRDAVNMALAKHSLPERSYDEVRAAVGNGARKLIERSVPPCVAADAEKLAQVFNDYETFYKTTYDRADRCYEGMLETMSLLSERGYRLAVLSNKQDYFVKKIAELLFPEGMISLTLGQTDMPKKPDPTVPLMIAERLGVHPSEAAFIGDSEVDIMTGKNAGMAAVGCSWGYRPRSLLEEMGADVIVDDPRELEKIFC